MFSFCCRLRCFSEPTSMRKHGDEKNDGCVFHKRLRISDCSDFSYNSVGLDSVRSFTEDLHLLFPGRAVAAMSSTVFGSSAGSVPDGSEAPWMSPLLTPPSARPTEKTFGQW